MKKIYKALFMLTVGAFTFTACEDVPAPYPIPGTEQGGDNSGQGGGGSTGLNVIFSEEFDGGQGDFVFNVVSNPSKLSYVWKSETYNTSTYLKASAYASSKSNEAEAWAVSPAINLKDSKKATLKFRHAINKIAPGVPSEMMTVWASTDYAGDVKTAKWTKLVVPTYPAGDSWTFVDAGNIDLNAFCGQAKVFIGFKYTSTNDYSGTWEVDAFEVLGDGTPMSDEPATPPASDGEGTLEKPYSVSEALALVASGNIPAENVYIKGVVCSIKEISTEYGNATYNISADGTTNGDQLTVFCGKYLNGDKFTSEDQLKVGDKVIVLGALTKYYDSPQVNTNSVLYSIESAGGNESPAGTGTVDNPYSVTDALAVIGSGEATTEEVYVKGVVSSIKEISTEYGNATYYISVDGTMNGDQLYVFRGKYLNGDKFTSESQLKVGDKVVILGVLTTYYDSPQISTNSVLYSIEGSTGGNTGGNEGEGEGSDDVIEGIYEATPDVSGNYLLNGDFESWSSNQPTNWKTACSAGNATLASSNVARSGKYSVLVKGTTKNTRISFREVILKPGTYEFSFYIRATGDVEGSCRPGVAYPPAEGSLSGNDYVYADYVNGINNSEWTQVTHEFTLNETKTVCVLVMNPKNPGKDFLIDDARLIKK